MTTNDVIFDPLDLIQDDQHLLGLEALFSQPLGHWVDLSALPTSLPATAEKVWICWLEEPPDEIDFFRKIVFVDRDTGSTLVASYNCERRFQQLRESSRLVLIADPQSDSHAKK